MFDGSERAPDTPVGKGQGQTKCICNTQEMSGWPGFGLSAAERFLCVARQKTRRSQAFTDAENN